MAQPADVALAESRPKQSPATALPRRTIQRLADTLAEALHPEKVILFGSHATGRAAADSDVDLFVVWETPLPPRERARRLRALLRPHCPRPLDVIAFTPAEFEYWRHTPTSFLAEILETGQVIYGAG
jgi:predicted nucleotidyltransferase